MLETDIEKGIALSLPLATTVKILINKPEEKGEINV